MRIFKADEQTVIVEHEGNCYRKQIDDWDRFINRQGLFSRIIKELSGFEQAEASSLESARLHPPVGSQEIWAAGVTYKRSKEARMEESKKAGGGSFYDRVYDADRPELFFKATARRTVGPEERIHIRRDSRWDVPEPELTLFISAQGSIEGYTVGNDMSSRSIEGENPLYLPQAKVFEKCAAIGPCIYVSDQPLSPDTEIELEIRRAGETAFHDKIAISQMKRSFEGLRDYLFRECSFPSGCFLMTGTGIVPPDSFTLEPDDEIRITIEPIGTLVNFVKRG